MIGTLHPWELHVVASRTKLHSLVHHHNQVCCLPYMTNTGVRESRLDSLRDATKDPSAFYLFPSIVNFVPVKVSSFTFHILCPSQEERRGRAKVQRHILADSAALGENFPYSAYVSEPELCPTVIPSLNRVWKCQFCFLSRLEQNGCVY